MEAVADGVGEASGGWERAEDEGGAAIIEGTQAGEKSGGEGVEVSPASPGFDDGRGVDGPCVGDEDSDAMLGVGGEEEQFPVERFGGAFDQDKAGAGSVVAQADAGGWERGLGGAVEFGRLEEFDTDAGDLGEALGGDGSGAIEDHGGLGGVEDGGFEADVGGAGVEDGVDAAVKVGEHVGGGGGAGVSEEVGAGSCDGQAGSFEQGESRRVRGDADTDERATGGDGVGNSRGARQEQGERAGPESFRQGRDAAGENRA